MVESQSVPPRNNRPTACEGNDELLSIRLGRFICTSGFSQAEAQAAIRAHRNCLAGGAGTILKNDTHTKVTLVFLPAGRCVCVKEYCWRGVWWCLKDLLRRPPARREWDAAQRLFSAGVSIARYFALVERAAFWTRDSAFLISEALEAVVPLNQFLTRAFPSPHDMAQRERKMMFLRAVADFLGGLHNRGICHRDMKSSNILIRELGKHWTFVLVDLADVRFLSPGRTAGRRHRLRNLAELNSSTPLVIGRTDRLRFLLHYARHVSCLQPIRRTWAEVIRRTSRRRCIWEQDADPPCEGATAG